MPRAVGLGLVESVMDLRALVKHYENLQKQFAHESLLRAGSLDGQSASFQYGKACGTMAGIQMVIEHLSDLIAEERKKDI